jgi:HEAT repeat protein
MRTKRTITMSNLKMNKPGSGVLRTAALLAGLFCLIAAQAAPSLDALLKDLAVFQNGGTEEVLHAFRAYVRAHRDGAEERESLETKLDAFLAGEATPAGKMAVCRELRTIGTERSVPVLAGLLAAAETTDAARYALEKIPGPAADKALIEALVKTSGSIKLGIIQSLGGRKSQSAVPDLAELVLMGDGATAGAAAAALGAVGGSDASKALFNLLGVASGEVKSRTASSLLLCGEELLKNKDTKAAAAIYDRVFGSKVSEPIRKAAFKGKVRASGGAAEEAVLAALGGRDGSLREAALDMIPEVFGPESIGRATALFPKFSAAEQIRYLSILADFPKETALPVIKAATDSPDASVRVEALRALEKIGDGSVVGLLAERAARARGPEQLAARTSLWGMKGADVDQAVLGLLAAASDEAVKAAAVRAVGERSIGAGKDALVSIVRSGPAALRLEAIRGLKGLAGPEDVSALLVLLPGLEDEAEQEEMQNLIAGVALTIVRPNARADAVKTLLAVTTDLKARGSLIRVLGKIGDDSGLPLIRKALAEGNPDLVDAAVRAFCDWPTAAAKDDVMAVARTSANSVHKVLALQAFIRMVDLDRYRNPAAAAADLENALKFASRPEERKLVLGVLPRFACPEARAIAESLLNDPEVKAEAAIAAARIKERLGG